MAEARLYTWDAIADVPPQGGLYAWYYRPLLTKRDIEDLREALAEAESRADQRAHVEAFLRRHIHAPLSEAPYEARLEGQLKPKYRGRLAHEPSITVGLLDRIAEAPDRLFQLRALFEMNPTSLASPLYIGMAANLRRRLRSHRRLIEEIRADASRAEVPPDMPEEDASFARTVVTRAIAPGRLSVYVLPMALDEALVDLENVLNRIFFPIFGRN